MRLNNDCVRDLLLAMMKNVGLKEYMSIDSLQLKSYSQDDLQYTAKTRRSWIYKCKSFKIS